MGSQVNDNVGSSRQPGSKIRTGVITLVQSNLTKLREYQRSLMEAERQMFRDTFGNFEKIMEVNSDEEAIRALIPFYDPQAQIFRLRHLDIAPTIEEYHYLLSPTWDRGQVKIYTQALERQPGFNLGMILQQQFGIKLSWSKGRAYKRDKYYDINWDGVYDAMVEDRKEGMTSQQKVHFLALGVFGLVLFPTTVGHVDSRVLLLILDILQKPKGNIATMILAETYRSLEHCSNHRSASYKICTQLLTVWIHNHFPTQNDHRTRNFFESSAWSWEKDLIGYYSLPACARGGRQEWYDLFNTVQPTEVNFANPGQLEGIRWKVPWVKDVNSYVISTPSNYSFPIYGLFGTVGYSPNWVTQQLGDEQEIPQFDTEKEFNKDYIKLTPEERGKFWEKWNLTEVKIARGGSSTISYQQWRANRMLHEKLPPNPRSTLNSKIAAWTKQLEEMKGNLLREKKRVVELEQQVKELQERLDTAVEQVVRCQDDADDGWKDRKKFTQEIERQKDRAKSAEKVNHRLREELAKGLEPDPKKIKIMLEE